MNTQSFIYIRNICRNVWNVVYDILGDLVPYAMIMFSMLVFGMMTEGRGEDVLSDGVWWVGFTMIVVFVLFSLSLVRRDERAKAQREYAALMLKHFENLMTKDATDIDINITVNRDNTKDVKATTTSYDYPVDPPATEKSHE